MSTSQRLEILVHECRLSIRIIIRFTDLAHRASYYEKANVITSSTVNMPWPVSAISSRSTKG